MYKFARVHVCVFEPDTSTGDRIERALTTDALIVHSHRFGYASRVVLNKLEHNDLIGSAGQAAKGFTKETRCQGSRECRVYLIAAC